MPEVAKKELLISYLKLRQLIGWLGIALPVALLLWTLITPDCNIVLDSISAYYHSSAGHLFVSITMCLAVVLWTYRGYEKDYILFRIAAALATVVAFVPNLQEQPVSGCFIRQNFSAVSDKIHLVAAVGFFLILAYICIAVFTKSSKRASEFGVAKQKRNALYKACGWVMLGTMLFLMINYFFPSIFLTKIKALFVGESIMLFAFGIAWLTKGQLMLKDK